MSALKQGFIAKKRQRQSRNKRNKRNKEINGKLKGKGEEKVKRSISLSCAAMFSPGNPKRKKEREHILLLNK